MDKWARKFEACVKCGETDHRHVGRGICAACYPKAAGIDWRKHDRRKVLKRHGLTPEQYEALWDGQQGKCAICRRAQPKLIKSGTKLSHSLHVDHDHATDRVRGLLCGKCNQGLGLFDDDEERLIRASVYLNRARTCVADETKQIVLN